MERVPVLPIHEKYAESRHEGQDLDPFDDIIGRLFKTCFALFNAVSFRSAIFCTNVAESTSERSGLVMLVF